MVKSSVKINKKAIARLLAEGREEKARIRVEQVRTSPMISCLVLRDFVLQTEHVRLGFRVVDYYSSIIAATALRSMYIVCFLWVCTVIDLAHGTQNRARFNKHGTRFGLTDFLILKEMQFVARVTFG